MEEHKVTITVNGTPYETHIKSNETLLKVLRNRLGFTSVKSGCEAGECGACTVILDGKTVNSCMVLGVEADGSEIITIEGIGTGEELHPIQKAFIEHGAIQCGFCTPGMILTAYDLLKRNPEPTEEEIKKAISGNLCRCTGYVQIIEAIKAASAKMR